MMKRVLMTFICIVAVCSQILLVNAAEDSITIDASKYTAVSDESVIEVFKRGTFISMNTGTWVEFQTDIDNPGIYSISQIAGSDKTVAKIPKLHFLIDGKYKYGFVGEKTNGWDDFATNTVEEVPLESGLHNIRIKIDDGSSYMSKLTLQKTSELTKDFKRYDFEYCTGETPDVDFHNASGTINAVFDNTRYAVSASEGDWMNYKTEAKEPGDHIFKLVYSCTEDAEISIIPESGKAVSAVLAATNGEYQYSSVNIPITAGTQNVRICINSGNCNLDYFTLQINSEYSNLLKQVNSAKDYKKIYNVLAGSALFSDNIIEQLGKLTFPEMAMRYLEGVNFLCYDELADRLEMAIKAEIANPAVKLTTVRGNDAMSAPTANTNRVTIDTANYDKPVCVVFALYSSGKLEGVSYNENSHGKTKLILSDMGFTYDKTKTYSIKAFFWENDRSMKPTTAKLDDSSFDANIYVNAAGNDKNTGSIVSPVKTIERAQTIAKNLLAENKSRNITVHVSGSHDMSEPLTFTMEDSPEDGYEMRYVGDGTAILNGGERIDNWTQYSDNIFVASVNTADIRQFYVNGDRKQRAKSDKIAGNEFFNDTSNDSLIQTDNITSSDITHPNKYVDGINVTSSLDKSQLVNEKNAELVWDILWTRQRIPVESFKTSEGTLQITLKQPYFGYFMTSGRGYGALTATTPFYIENALAYLDEPGEFYFDKENKKIYYYPETGEELTNCYAGKCEGFIRINGTDSNNRVQNITFEGLTFEYGTWLEPNNEGLIHLQSDNIADGYNSRAPIKGKRIHAQISLNWARNIKIINNNILHSGSSGIELNEGVKSCEISGNTIYDTSGAAVSIGSWLHNFTTEDEKMCTAITVSDNIIQKAATEYCGAAAVSCYYVSGVTVTHNNIEDTAYSGISLGWGWGTYTGKQCKNNEISYNRIENVVNVLMDGAGIYTLGDMPNTVIKGNYVSKSYSKATNNLNNGYHGGIYCDEGSENITVEGNVVDNCYNWFFSNVTTQLAGKVNLINNFADTNNNRLGTNTVESGTVVCSDGWTESALAVISSAGARIK